MLRKIVPVLLFVLQLASPLYAQPQNTVVKYLDAKAVMNMAKSSGKPYLWLTVYVPKCANASDLFSKRVAYYNKEKDKVNLVMLSILSSNDNIIIHRQFSETFKFDSPFYVMDTMYTKENVRETPMKFMKDLNGLLGVEDQFVEHIIIDKNGKLVYRGDDIDADKLDALLK